MDPSPRPAWIAPIFLPHLGCPYRCVFCNQHLIAETASPPSPAEVAEQLETFWTARKGRAGNRKQIAFYGGSFTRMPRAQQDAYLGVCQPFLRRRWVDSIRISTRPDAVSAGELAFLARRGVKTVELGVQSLSDRVLRASRRGYTGEEAREGVRRTRRMGLEVGVQLMVGLPGDSGKESLQTVEAVASLEPDFVRIYPVLVLRETELAGRMRTGRYRPLELEEAVSLCASMLERLEERSIPVIRIGLQEQVGMGCEDGFVLAGPYHPAFGHLVRSALFLRKALSSLPKAIPPSSKVCLRIHPHDRSLLVGDHRQNLKALQDVLASRVFRIEEDPGIHRGTVQWANRSPAKGQRRKEKERPGLPSDPGWKQGRRWE
jgi:histone acetyltransferase (RNA polymerase elongator complex component)